MAEPSPVTTPDEKAIAHQARPTARAGYRIRKIRTKGLLLALVILIADRAAKLWFLAHWQEAGVLTLAPMLDFRLVWNPGISLGLLQDGGVAVTIVTAFVTGGVAWWLWRVRESGEALSLGLVLGGALGNLWDRLQYGAVVDFVHFHVGGWSFYVFNLADAALSLGAAAMILFSFRQMRAESRSDPEPS